MFNDIESLFPSVITTGTFVSVPSKVYIELGETKTGAIF
jgi:hypothetical protein